MKKFFFTSLFLALIIGTSFVKNTTKTLDKEIFEKRENITLLQNKYELVLLDFNYLSSPDRLKKYQQIYFEKVYVVVVGSSYSIVVIIVVFFRVHQKRRRRRRRVLRRVLHRILLVDHFSSPPSSGCTRPSSRIYSRSFRQYAETRNIRTKLDSISLRSRTAGTNQ